MTQPEKSKQSAQKRLWSPWLPALGALLLALLVLLPFAAAQTETILRLLELDSNQFPNIRLNLFASDQANSPITDFSELTLRENGQPVTDFEVNQIPVGVNLIFVIDANAGINNVDFGNELSRLELIRDSISRYATEFMNSDGRDTV